MPHKRVQYWVLECSLYEVVSLCLKELCAVCWIWGSHSGGYEEYDDLGYHTLYVFFMLVSCLAYSSNLKIEAMVFSELRGVISQMIELFLCTMLCRGAVPFTMNCFWRNLKSLFWASHGAGVRTVKNPIHLQLLMKFRCTKSRLNLFSNFDGHICKPRERQMWLSPYPLTYGLMGLI
jgi:hypothetical protein